MADEKENWHLDKKVPIAIIFAIAVQTAGVIWWGANVHTRLMQVETNIQDLKRDDRETANKLNILNERTTRVETNTSSILDQFRLIFTKIDRIEDLVSRQRINDR